MNQHWFNRSGRYGVIATIMLATPAALVYAEFENFDPPPGDFWGHVDIPEIGIGGGGGHKTNDTKNTDPFAAFTTGDDLLGLRLSNWSLSLKNGDFAITQSPTIGIMTNLDSGSISTKSFFDNGQQRLPINLGISSVQPKPSATFGDGSQPTGGSAIPTPGAGVLLIGGLALLSARRRRPV